MSEAFDSWAIVEVMGHQTYAGRVTEQTIGGASFVRVDVPEVGDQPAFTKLFSAGSIYAITPTTEEIARIAATRHVRHAVSLYDLPREWQEKIRQPMSITGPADDDEDCNDGEF